MRQLIYIGQTPAAGTGSPVIMLRHLRRLAARGDWHITVVAEPGQDASACMAEGWDVLTLPTARRWHWPPYRADVSPEFLRAIRTRLIARALRARLRAQFREAGPGGIALVAYLAAHADFSAEIASHLAAQTGAPLSLHIHDDAAAFASAPGEKEALRRRHACILARAHRNHFVSPELAAACGEPPGKNPVLYPIPEGGAHPPEWREKYSVRPRIYYAGHVWPAQYPLLARLARAIEAASARLVLLTRDTPELRAFLAANPADWQPPFPENTAALAHLAANAAALLVSYTDTVAEMPWIATSFPSKLAEYAHLGLPAAIIAPPDSAVGRWASRENYPHVYANENSPAFTAWLAALRGPVTWAASAAPPHRMAMTIFDPGMIQRQWEGGLLE